LVIFRCLQASVQSTPKILLCGKPTPVCKNRTYLQGLLSSQHFLPDVKKSFLLVEGMYIWC
jgi:hypothetical protein